MIPAPTQLRDTENKSAEKIRVAIHKRDQQQQRYARYKSHNNTLHFSLLALFICIFSVSYYLFFYAPNHVTPESPTKDDINKIDRQFSVITGEHILLKGLAKRHLSAPSSYEHIETTYTTNYNTKELTVRTYFYGENFLGTRFKTCMTAIYDYEGLLKSPPQECS